jgi:hypothetical protein
MGEAFRTGASWVAAASSTRLSYQPLVASTPTAKGIRLSFEKGIGAALACDTSIGSEDPANVLSATDRSGHLQF